MMKKISKLYLMVHPTPRNAKKVKTYFDRWEQFLSKAAVNSETVLCVLSNSAPEMQELSRIVNEIFGERCFMDPDDWSDATKLKYVEMVDTTFNSRGIYGKYGIYGLWTDKNAIRWTEGLKRDLATRGFMYSSSELQVFGFGAMWGGCMTKYTALMASHLQVEKTPKILPELCHDAGYSVDGEYLEKKELSNQVWAFLFKANNNMYFAQFMESLRPASGHPKLVKIKTTNDDCFIHAGNFNGHIPVATSSVTFIDGKAQFPVMDGYLSPNITVFWRDSDFKSFKQTMFAAEVSIGNCQNEKISVGLLPYQSPAPLDFN